MIRDPRGTLNGSVTLTGVDITINAKMDAATLSVSLVLKMV